MFRRITLTSLLLTCLLAVHLIWRQTSVSQADKDRYYDLLTESKEFRSKKALERKPGTQTREKVQKQIWRTENETRAPIQIFASRSELTFLQKKNSFEIKEQLFGVEAWMEKGRHFTAAEGMFTYPEQKFIAFETTLKIEPDDFIYAPKIEIDLLKNQITCNLPKGSYRQIDFQSETLVFHPQKESIELLGKVELKQQNMTASGEKALLTPTLATLDGGVLVKALEGTGIADQLVLHPETKELTLSSPRLGRVLFSKQDMRLSAPEIVIDFETSKIRGKGDVRFSFTLEEENEMDKFMQRFAPP